MIHSGAKPTKVSHLDYDFLKNHKFGAIPQFPPNYLTDANLWMPNQNEANKEFNLPPMPYGCTNFTQSDLSADIDGILKNPLDLEAITHANAKGGEDIRVSLVAAVKLGWIKAFYNIRASGSLDIFDAIRLAAYSSQPEKRSVSWGTPWFPSWEQLAQQGVAIMPLPTPEEIVNVSKNSNAYPWHNSKLSVWHSITGVPYLKNKSWQGTGVGDRGWLYFPREVVNVVMSLKNTVAYTASQTPPTSTQRIDVTLVQFIVSFIRNLFSV